MNPVYRMADWEVRKGGRAVLREINLELQAGELVVVMGANGSGKSTLLRSLAGLEKGAKGEVRLGKQAMGELGRRQMAQQVALVEATLDLPFALTAEEIALMGRAPHSLRWRETEEDRHKAEAALAAMDCAEFAKRDFRTLSSGEKQRVIVASALAQEPCVLLLDEPAAFLDLAHQQDLFARLRLLADSGLLVVAVTHDWNLAALWATRIVLMKQGSVFAQGTAQELGQARLLEQVFGLPLRVEAGPVPFVRPWRFGEREDGQADAI